MKKFPDNRRRSSRPTLALCAFTMAVLATAGTSVANDDTSHKLTLDNPTATLPTDPPGVRYSAADEAGRNTYLIDFAGDSLIQHHRKTAPGQKFDQSRSPGLTAYRNELKNDQASHIGAIASLLGRQVTVSHYYLTASNGIATRLTPAEAETVAALPFVKAVRREQVQQLHTYRSPEFVGATQLWSGAAVPSGLEIRGEGVVVGVIDTGVDPVHPAFANNASCGHGAGAVPNKLLSAVSCYTTDVNGVCTGTDVDFNSHGTHVASTAAGNPLNTSSGGSPTPPGGATEFSGMAPCAHVRSFKACGLAGEQGCGGSALEAALNNVLAAGDIDVVNYSISGGGQPWSTADSGSFFLDMVESGMFVAASAGNTGTGTPNPVGQVNHRGPWIMTVAASTHDGNGAQGDVLAGFSLRGPIAGNLADLTKPDITAPGVDIFAGAVQGRISATGPGTPPSQLEGIPMDKGSVSPIGTLLSNHPIRHYTGQPATAEGCTAGEDGVPGDLAAFPAGFFNGSIAVIRRGSCGFAKKITNATNAGAVAVLITNNQAGGISMNTTDQPAGTPAYSVSDQATGEALIAFIDANPGNALATYAPLPGDRPSYTLMGGTSMSSPHIAGLAALLRQAQPEWTVSEIKSAMMMTATTGTREDGTTPWDPDDVGSGRIVTQNAVQAGLVMNESAANFRAANPALSGDVRTLNLASMRNTNCTPNCTWTRTVRNTLSAPSSWTAEGMATTNGVNISIEPSSFSFTGDLAQTQTLTITASPTGDMSAAVAFGNVVLSESADLSPDLHLTVAIRGIGEDPPVEDAIFCNGFENGGDGSCDGGAGPGDDIVVVDDIDFTFNQDGTGGSVRWHDGFTCQCDGFGTGDPDDLNFNIYYDSASSMRFYWAQGASEGGVVASGSVYAILQSGATIGPGSGFTTFNDVANHANWSTATGSDGQLGFRFSHEGITKYGYAHLTMGANGRPVSISRIVYNNVGDPITIP